MSVCFLHVYRIELMNVFKGQTLVIRNEILEFVVTLRNPYVFDLELQTLALR